MLNVKPVENYPVPSYPTQEQITQDPALLRALPRRFHARPAVVTALSALISLGLTGCGTPVPEEDPEPGRTLGRLPAEAVLKIPVFPRGSGRGSYGCVSVAPPVFLSEEEAAQVIREEAELYGLDFSGNKTLSGIKLPVPNLYEFTDENTGFKTASGDLDLDGHDGDIKIGYEFVSVSDIQAWSKASDAGVSASVESYNASGAAAKLSEGVENTAVFYDPMSADFHEFDPPAFEGMTEGEYGAAFEAAIEEYEMKQKEKSLAELRAQVKDFLEWLKGQGVI